MASARRPAVMAAWWKSNVAPTAPEAPRPSLLLTMPGSSVSAALHLLLICPQGSLSATEHCTELSRDFGSIMDNKGNFPKRRLQDQVTAHTGWLVSTQGLILCDWQIWLLRLITMHCAVQSQADL